jgi:hypothetical protein
MPRRLSLPEGGESNTRPSWVHNSCAMSSRDDDGSHEDDSRWLEDVKVVNLLSADDMQSLARVCRSRRSDPAALRDISSRGEACTVLKYWELREHTSDLPKIVNTIIRNILTFCASTSTKLVCNTKTDALHDIYSPSGQFLEALHEESKSMCNMHIFKAIYCYLFTD